MPERCQEPTHRIAVHVLGRHFLFELKRHHTDIAPQTRWISISLLHQLPQSDLERTAGEPFQKTPDLAFIYVATRISTQSADRLLVLSQRSSICNGIASCILNWHPLIQCKDALTFRCLVAEYSMPNKNQEPLCHVSCHSAWCFKTLELHVPC